jgi:hypothetical protein
MTSAQPCFALNPVPEVLVRKLLLIPAFVVVASVVGVLAQTPAAGKVDTQWKCTPPNPMNAIPIGDAPDHAYVIQQSKCTAAKGEIAGVKNKDGVATEFMEGKGDTGSGHGIFIETFASGDKITYTYTFSGVSKNHMLVSGSDKWTMTEGTGKFKGIKGSGTCAAKGNPDGSGVYDCMGTYTVGK